MKTLNSVLSTNAHKIMGRNIPALNLIGNKMMLILTIRKRILELLGGVIKKLGKVDLRLRRLY